MSIKGPITITIEGPQGSGKTIITDLFKSALFYRGIDWMEYKEKEDIQDKGQIVTFIEKQT